MPSIGRAVRVEGAPAPEADLTRALYEQYANQIFRYCLNQLGSREEAEDAVQSTFLNAFRGIKRGIVPELESAWLFKIANNVCLSRRRTSWRRGRIESPTDFDAVEELTPAPSRRADELMGLQDVLEEMPENQRRAILLREWQGLSYREIAEELELSQAAVETLIFRARRSLVTGLEQPPKAKRRIVRGVDIGNILAGLKTLLLGGGAAVKVAATVAVVSAGTVVAAAPVQQHRAHSPSAPSGAAASVAGPAVASPVQTGAQPQARSRLQRSAVLVAGRSRPAGSATPNAAAPPEPTASAPAAEPAPAPLVLQSAVPQSAVPQSAPAQPADTPHAVKPQHARAGTSAPADKTASGRSDSKRRHSEQRTTSSSVGETTTLPVETTPTTRTPALSRAMAALPGAAPAGVQSGATPTGKEKNTSKGDH